MNHCASNLALFYSIRNRKIQVYDDQVLQNLINSSPHHHKLLRQKTRLIATVLYLVS